MIPTKTEAERRRREVALQQSIKTGSFHVRMHEVHMQVSIMFARTQCFVVVCPTTKGHRKNNFRAICNKVLTNERANNEVFVLTLHLHRTDCVIFIMASSEISEK